MQIRDIADLSRELPAHRYLPRPERLISGHPEQSVQHHFSSTNGQFNAGVWQGEPGRWRVVYTEDEYCEILSGRSLIHDRNGHVKVVEAGDRFVIPAGFEGIWEVVDTCKKVYVTFEA
jgi:uncharacterized cupin superfamily protein